MFLAEYLLSQDSFLSLEQAAIEAWLVKVNGKGLYKVSEKRWRDAFPCGCGFLLSREIEEHKSIGVRMFTPDSSRCH